MTYNSNKDFLQTKKKGLSLLTTWINTNRNFFHKVIYTYTKLKKQTKNKTVPQNNQIWNIDLNYTLDIIMLL